MVRSEAQKKADKKYQKKSNVIKTIKLTKGIDDDIINYIDEIDQSFNSLIKELMRERIEKDKKIISNFSQNIGNTVDK